MNLRRQDVISLNKLKELIDKHPEKEYSLISLANSISMNIDKLKTGFKELFGKTVFVYIREQRLQRAKDMIEQTDETEARIAKQVGFKSLPNFINAFKKQYCCLPHSLRTTK